MIRPDQRGRPEGHRVALVRDASIRGYPSPRTAYGPGEAYPEYRGERADDPNPVYDAVRSTLAELGLDSANFGTPSWNPMSELLDPGQRVLLKPNWVFHRNKSDQGMDCLVTHPAVVRAVLDYVLLADPSEVIVGDAPVQSCDLEKLWEVAGYSELIDHFRLRGSEVQWEDFRRTILLDQIRPQLDQRPMDRFVEFDLGHRSALEPIAADWRKFRVTKYDPDLMLRTHRPGVHRYLIAREALDADLVVNLPKLKTHMKAGITAALKNLVGINGHKDYLPHHRKGGSGRGGDCYPGRSLWKAWHEDLLDAANRSSGRKKRYLLLLASACAVPTRLRGEDTKVEGAWHGNDTVWRMTLDLNQILIFGRRDGSLAPSPQRLVLHLTDGIVAGEGEGPLASSPKQAGVVTGALNPVAADYLHASLMGFDWRKVHLVREAFSRGNHALAEFAPAEIEVLWQGRVLRQPWGSWGLSPFEPPSGWRGHCESEGGPSPGDQVLVPGQEVMR